MVKNPPADAGDLGDSSSIPGWGRSPGGGNGNPLQCSCLENPRDGGAWWAAVYGVAQSRTRLKQLSSSITNRLISLSPDLQAPKQGSKMSAIREVFGGERCFYIA